MAKTLQELNLEDDFLFAKVMENKDICKITLEKILRISIQRIEYPETQKTINILPSGRGIRLDVYVNDEVGSVYNCEMQRSNLDNLPKRSRYYQSVLDLDMLAKGEPYEELRKTFIIFICTFDLFESGHHLYYFENTCRDAQQIHLGDEVVKIFLNTKGTMYDVSEEMKAFLRYVEIQQKI